MKKNKYSFWQKEINPIYLIIPSLILVLSFIKSYTDQENRISEKLNDCSYYTIMQPIRMPDGTKVYFRFNYDGTLKEYSCHVGSNKVFVFDIKKEILNNRYWLRVNCKDYKVNRVIWDIPVPDTLHFIPNSGWKFIPYGLDQIKLKRKYFN